MKSILTSLTLVLLFSGSVFSQGPAKGMTISKRTIIRDSLGQVIKLSDCTEKLKSTDWILHPENNEQGKLLHLLLKRTTTQEKELLSDERVSDVSSEQFDKIKRGRYILTAKDGSETRIRRRGNKQIECTKNEDGSKQKIKYRIAWLDDASYILKPWNKVTEMAKTPRYKIVEVTDASYAVRVVNENSLGPVIQLTKR
ncbi:MAG: hypothetical protein AB8B56_21910 [Crocinitomicaceae bacterium]